MKLRAIPIIIFILLFCTTDLFANVNNILPDVVASSNVWERAGLATIESDYLKLVEVKETSFSRANYPISQDGQYVRTAIGYTLDSVRWGFNITANVAWNDASNWQGIRLNLNKAQFSFRFDLPAADNQYYPISISCDSGSDKILTPSTDCQYVNMVTYGSATGGAGSDFYIILTTRLIFQSYANSTMKVKDLELEFWNTDHPLVNLPDASCSGTQLLSGDPEELSPAEVWSTPVDGPTNAQIVYTIANPGNEIYAHGAASIAGWNATFLRNMGAGTTYSITLPVGQRIDMISATARIENTGDDPYYLLSACVISNSSLPPPVYTCVNADPNLLDVNAWQKSTGVTLTGGIAEIPPARSIWANESLGSGDFIARITAQGANGDKLIVMLGSTPQTVRMNGLWQEFAISFDDINTLARFSVTAPQGNAGNIQVRRICIASTSGGAQPPGYETGTCYNTDPPFDNAAAWGVAGGAQITGNEAVLPATGFIFQDIELPGAGTYQIDFRARTATTGTLTFALGAQGMNVSIAGGGTSRGYTMTMPAYTENVALMVNAASANPSTIYIDNLCVSLLELPGGRESSVLWHPVCQRDWNVLTDFASGGNGAIVVGSSEERGGMPVSAIYGGTVNSMSSCGAYDNCIVVDHNLLEYTSARSCLCNVTQAISGTVARGQNVGFTLPYDNGDLQVYLELNGSWVDPADNMAGYPDCLPWRTVVVESPVCVGDAGNGTWIQPKYNSAWPGTDIAQYIPWLAEQGYDFVAYPIECFLADLYHDAQQTALLLFNTLLAMLDGPYQFTYRISRIFTYLLGVLARAFTLLLALVQALAALIQCVSSAVGYFVAALAAASSAEVDLLEFESGAEVAVALSLSLLLIRSTVANLILTPMVGLIIAMSAWKLVPWGIQTLRRATTGEF